MELNIRKYGIEPNTGKDMTKSFLELLEDIRGNKEEKLLFLPKGEYHLYFKNAKKRIYYITNTVSQSEMAIPERTIAMHIKNTENLVIDGNNSKIVLHGLMTAMIIDGCNNVFIKNLIIEYDRPPISLMEIEKKKLFSTICKIHPKCKYEIKKGKLYFIGDNFSHDVNKVYRKSWGNIVFDKTIPDIIRRTLRNPFRGAYRYTALEDGRVKIDYLLPTSVKRGEMYEVHRNVRSECGIVIVKSNKIKLKNIEERSNISFAVVAQFSHDITLEKLRLAANEEDGLFASSQADFVHICMCSGKFVLKDSYFSGAFDDCLNVHGVHFKICKIMDNLITIKFMHPQAYGYNPFDEGDEIELIDSQKLVSKNVFAKVKSSIMVSSYEIELTLDKNLDSAKLGDSIENITKIPEVEVSGNYFSRVPTRGVLMTVGKKVVIKNNTFYKTQMSGLLVSDDAKSWYESGKVTDMLITGNKFIDCKGQAIYICPENWPNKDIVHRNIVIEDNEFDLNGNLAVNASNSELTIRNNKYINEGECLNKINNCILTIDESQEVLKKTIQS